MKPIVIVGAGFSGLSLAWELTRHKIPVLIVEKNARVGGMIQTTTTPYGFAETAANGFLRTERVEKFFAELQVPTVRSGIAAKNRYIFRHGIRRWPLGAVETLGTFAKILRGFSKGRRFFRPGTDETLLQWGRRCIGESATRHLLCVALQGIYGPDTENLSAELVIGPMFRRKKSKRLGGLLTGPKGMSSILEKLHSALVARGVEIRFKESFSWDRYREFETIVICTDVNEAAILLGPRCPKAAEVLSGIHTWDVASVKIFSEHESQAIKPGFGILFPRGEGVASLGVLFNATIFGWPQKSETWILPDVTHESEDLKRVLQDRKSVLNLADHTVQGSHVDLWKKGLPVYDLHLQKSLEILGSSDELSRAGIFLHGNYLGHIGLSRILEASADLAERLKILNNNGTEKVSARESS